MLNNLLNLLFWLLISKFIGNIQISICTRYHHLRCTKSFDHLTPEQWYHRIKKGRFHVSHKCSYFALKQVSIIRFLQFLKSLYLNSLVKYRVLRDPLHSHCLKKAEWFTLQWWFTEWWFTEWCTANFSTNSTL